MQVSSTLVSSSLAATFRPSATAAFALLGRLAQALPAPLPPSDAGTLTPEMIRAALLEMGVGAAEADVVLATALAQAGLPLTALSLTEAYQTLARAPGATPEAYALAKSLALPTTPDALKALTAALTAPAKGLPVGQALPESVRESLVGELEAGPEILGRHLRERMLETSRSVEHHLAQSLREGEAPSEMGDARTVLLRLAQEAGDPTLRAEADALAAHLEGQQLLLQASVQAHAGKPETPLYLAIPLVFGGQSSLAEVQIWVPNRRTQEQDEEERGAEALRVTVRMRLPRLGRVQAELSGRMTGNLSCRLGAEKAGAQRLLARHAGALALAFSEAGWPSCDVCCCLQPEWPPLWHGGAALATPRACVDRRV